MEKLEISCQCLCTSGFVKKCIYLKGIWVVSSNFDLKTGISVNHQFWP